MPHYKLPFSIQLERKYNDINIDDFVKDWAENEKNRKERIISMDNELHIELGKFKTFDIDINEIIDLGMRYALCKREFRRMMAQVIEQKTNKI
ncbi:hypothetical protein PG593_03550 [Riemerella anatipestifer]|uniref:hypothetical protein n=1 Tax=Riemerella anatipestifer TaxID=34085 RepID=UPI000699637F|nr:hypothetical protein [Riemerella anatipestifer]MDR7693405.1 hypothetical protein [Riemerella anatipestifer]MDY3528854.1 hypothetical protein [Riemerella anatipestifer]MDY3538069.1 hypothetical protein [Riemerella anatipestifer]